MTKTSQLPLSSAYVLTMNLPFELKVSLAKHVEKIITISCNQPNQHSILKVTCPGFYEDFITHIKTLNN